MKHTMYIGIDQYDVKHYLPDLKHETLREVIGYTSGCRINKMYIDKKDGSTVQIGFVIGQGQGQPCRWVTIYKRMEIDS